MCLLVWQEDALRLRRWRYCDTRLQRNSMSAFDGDLRNVGLSI